MQQDTKDSAKGMAQAIEDAACCEANRPMVHDALDGEEVEQIKADGLRAWLDGLVLEGYYEGRWPLNSSAETAEARRAYLVVGTGGPGIRVAISMKGSDDGGEAWIEACEWFREWEKVCPLPSFVHDALFEDVRH